MRTAHSLTMVCVCVCMVKKKEKKMQKKNCKKMQKKLKIKKKYVKNFFWGGLHQTPPRRRHTPHGTDTPPPPVDRQPPVKT